jgi:hypothetical protein
MGAAIKPHEHGDMRKIGRATYLVTNVFLRERSLNESMENFIIRRIVDDINAGTRETVNA